MGSYSVLGEVYYAVIETSSHFFLVYADFHPRDWSESCLVGNCHENDMEGVMLAIKKDGSTYGKFQAMFTVAHSDFFSYKDYQSTLSNAVTNDGQTIDGDVQFYQSTHPYVYIEAKGHGNHGADRWETSGFPGGAGCRSSGVSAGGFTIEQDALSRQLDESQFTATASRQRPGSYRPSPRRTGPEEDCAARPRLRLPMCLERGTPTSALRNANEVPPIGLARTSRR